MTLILPYKKNHWICHKGTESYCVGYIIHAPLGAKLTHTHWLYLNGGSIKEKDFPELYKVLKRMGCECSEKYLLSLQLLLP